MSEKGFLQDVRHKMCIRDSKCGGHATVFLSGDVAAVKAAVDAMKENPPCEIVAAAVISAPSEETSRLVEEEEEKHHK